MTTKVANSWKITYQEWSRKRKGIYEQCASSCLLLSSRTTLAQSGSREISILKERNHDHCWNKWNCYTHYFIVGVSPSICKSCDAKHQRSQSRIKLYNPSCLSGSYVQTIWSTDNQQLELDQVNGQTHMSKQRLWLRRWRSLRRYYRSIDID